LLGTTVTSLRLAHALFAVATLASAYFLLVRSRVPRWWSAAVCCALAIDRSFVFAFRTQSYITIAPVAWLLLAVEMLRRRASTTTGSKSRLFYLSGALFGLSVYGYFVYGFYAPALAIAVVVWDDSERRSLRASLRNLVVWIAGICTGCAFYFVGYWLLARSQGGLTGLLRYIQLTVTDVGAFAADQSLPQRLVTIGEFVESIYFNWWHNALMFNDYTPAPGAMVKMVVLLAIPAVLWLVAELRQVPCPLLRLLVALQCSFAATALVFGNRLGGHHFASLLVMSYVALAVAGHPFMRREQIGRLRLSMVDASLAVIGFLLVANIAGEVQEFTLLAKTRGLGLFSDAIDRFVADLLVDQRQIVFMPDWGLFAPVAFLTGGNIDLVTEPDNYTAANATLCARRSVRVALITGDRLSRFKDWARATTSEVVQVADYNQFDGKTVFQVATLRRGVADEAQCVASSATRLQAR
jgi:hypothetical protein